MYSGIIDLWPNCTVQRCCPEGFTSVSGQGCDECGTDTYSYTGATHCFDCPANSHSPIRSPMPLSCICDEGYVGESGGLIETPADKCLTCPKNTYAYTELERVSSKFSKTVKNTGVYATSAGCIPCPANSRSPGGVESYTAWACECDAGYICSVGNLPCEEWLQNLNDTWARRTCLASNNTINPTAAEVWACNKSGVSGIEGWWHGPKGSNRHPCNNTGPGCNGTKDASGNPLACTCGCSAYAGYEPGYPAPYNQTNVAPYNLWYCVDKDECAKGTHNCSASETCENLWGLQEVAGIQQGFRCVCGRGKVAEGGVCKDVDECALATHDCHANAECTNTDGSFACNCSRGFQGDGVLDCSDGRQRSCTTVFEISATSAASNRSICWAQTNVLQGGPFYCDSDAGTTNEIYLRLYWFELQGWSEEILVTSQNSVGLAAGATIQFYKVRGRPCSRPAFFACPRRQASCLGQALALD